MWLLRLSLRFGNLSDISSSVFIEELLALGRTSLCAMGRPPRNLLGFAFRFVRQIVSRKFALDIDHSSFFFRKMHPAG